MKYAYISVLAPMPEGEESIPAAWTAPFPDGAYFAAFVVEKKHDLDMLAKTAGGAIERKAMQDGWPQADKKA